MTPTLPAIREFLAVTAESSIYYHGNIPLYIKELQCRASRECRKSQYLLGLHYKIGFGVKTNRRKEKYWQTEAANAGYPKAQKMLAGEMEDTIQSCFFDHKDQPDLRNPEILCGLGICYEQGIGTLTRSRPDLEKAFSYFQLAATPRRRHGHARYKVAEAYEFGRGVKADMTQAVAMYKKAAVRRHTGACLRLAQILEGYYDFPPDPKEALGYLRLGSRTGDAMCQHELGLCHLSGRLGVEVDEEKAVTLFIQSTKNGWPYAAYDLGKCYFHGKGTLKNPRKAKKLIEKAYKNSPDPELIACFWNENELWKY